MIKLVKSNIRKDRAVLSFFLLIIILSSMLLQTGLFMNRYDELYDEKKERAGVGDIELYTYGSQDKIKAVLEGMTEITDCRMAEIIRSDETTLISEDKKYEENRSDVLIHSIEDEHVGHCRFLERDEGITGRKIYLNLYYAASNDFTIGDKITLSAAELITYEYTVAGIYEDIQQGNNYSWCSVCLDDASFREQYISAGKMSAEGISFADQNEAVVKLAEGCDSDKMLNVIISALDKEGISAYGFTMKLAKAGYVSITNILAAFITVFSIVAMMVCFVMIVFTINNNIDRDIRNIGALRAVGHTVRQIRTALIEEYLLTGITGTAVGIGLAYIIMPILDRKLLRPVTGMYWEKRFYPLMAVMIIAGLVLTLLLIVMISTGKLRKLHPATALRFGLQSNSFKKNHLPLASARGSLSPLLAVKSMLQNKIQNLIVFGVIVIVSFMTFFSGILFYNTRVDISRFQTLISGDVEDGLVLLGANGEETGSISRKLESIPDVSEVYGYNWHNISVDGYSTYIFYTDHPEYLECGVYEGQMFREDNEVVIGKKLADKMGVKIGDEIEVEYAGHSARFLITGYQQAVVNLGERVFATAEGVRKLGIEPEFSELRIRIADPDEEKVDKVLAEAREMLGSDCAGTENTYRYQRSSDNLTMFAALLLILLLILVNVAIIFLVIKLLLKTVFIKKEKEFGIKKAIGFTSRQLRIQLALTLFPVSILAAATGAVLGLFLVNPLLSGVFGGFGIAKADFIICPSIILFTVVVIGILVFGVTYLMSGRMKKISAYELMQE